MKIKTIELQGAALDWAVMKCEHPKNENVPFFHQLRNESAIYDENLQQTHTGRFRYSERWDQGGPIIERERISINFDASGRWSEGWRAFSNSALIMLGETTLIAAMRCYVTSKLGDEVEIPDELEGLK
jgi:hypothetical protein